MPRVSATARAIVRDALLVVAVCTVVGATVNGVRANGIPYLQRTEYAILVPCPDSSGEAPGLEAHDASLWAPRTLLVDARAAADHQRWHPAETTHLAFDYLQPAAKDEVRRIASSGAARVVVFGDGADPDSGEQLARELAGAGIRNVFFVRGGAEALRSVAAARSPR